MNQAHGFRWLGVAAAVVFAMASQATAQVFTWDGGGDPDPSWTTDLNWEGDEAPPFAVGGDLIFDGSTNVNPVADEGAENWRDIDSLLFAETAETFIISGGSLTFNDEGGIFNASEELQALANDVIASGDAFTLDAGPGTLLLGDAENPGVFELTNGMTLSVTADDPAPEPDAVHVVVNHVMSGEDLTVDVAENTSLLLNGANTYSGETVLNSGSALWLTNADAAGDSAIHVAGQSMLATEQEMTLDNQITLDDTLTIVPDQPLTLDGQITGEGGITLSAEGELTLTGDNDYTGGTTLDHFSVLTLGSDTALGEGPLTVVDEAVAAVDVLLGEDEEQRSIANAVQMGADGTLAVVTSDHLQLTGDVSGGGQVVVDQDATLTLSGDNTFSGGTQLFDGSLLLIGSETALGAGDLAVADETEAFIAAEISEEEDVDVRTIDNNITLGNQGSLSVTGGTDIVADGVISGDGLLEVAFAEEDFSLTLTQANTYTGGTRLRLGDVTFATDTAFGTGPITMDGIVSITTMAGEGARTLDYRFEIPEVSSNDGPPSWLITQGEENLTLANSGGEDGLHGGGVLRLDMDDATVFLVDDHSAFEGSTQVVEGSTLQLDGVLGGDVIAGVTSDDFDQGGILQGTGRITGDLSGFAQGTIRPGDSIGTMEVDGDFTLRADSTLEIELDVAEGTADLIQVGGDVQLREDSIIDVIQLDDAALASDDAFTIIEADGVITDEGAIVLFETDNPLRTLSGRIVSENGMQVYQLVTSGEVFTLIASGRNNEAVAAALNSLNDADVDGDVSEFLMDLATIENEAAFNRAMEQLSPEGLQVLDQVNTQNNLVYSANLRSYLAARRRGGPIMAGLQMSHGGGMDAIGGSFATPPAGLSHEQIVLSLQLAEEQMTVGEGEAAPRERGRAVPRRIAGRRVSRPQTGGGFAEDDRWGFFGQALGGYHELGGDTYRSGYRARVAGGQFGVDYNVDDQLTAGLGFAYNHTDADLRHGHGEIDLQSFRVGPYLGWTDASNRWFIDGSATFGFHDVESERFVQPQDATASGSYDAYDASLYAGTGYPFHVGDFTLTPRGSVQYVYLHQDGFTESGAGPANLRVHSRDAHSLRTLLGGSVSTYLHAGSTIVVPELFLGWEYEAMGDDDIAATFAAGGDAFSISPNVPARNAAAIGAAVNLLLTDNVSGFVRYEGRVSEDGHAHGLGAGMSLRF